MAALSHYDPDGLERRSPLLAGKGPDGRPLHGHHHAHYLAFARGGAGAPLLDTLVTWVPGPDGEDGPGGMDRANLDALTSITSLGRRDYLSDFRPCNLGLEAYGAVEDIAPELCGAHRVWKTATPFIPPRHTKRNVAWVDHIAGEVKRELAYRGQPPPVRVDLVVGDWLAYRTHRVRERLRSARRAVGVRIEFSEPVSGPLCLGSLSHFGMGLFLPERNVR